MNVGVALPRPFTMKYKRIRFRFCKEAVHVRKTYIMIYAGNVDDPFMIFIKRAFVRVYDDLADDSLVFIDMPLNVYMRTKYLPKISVAESVYTI
jgi:hypothetical protein